MASHNDVKRNNEERPAPAMKMKKVFVRLPHTTACRWSECGSFGEDHHVNVKVAVREGLGQEHPQENFVKGSKESP